MAKIRKVLVVDNNATIVELVSAHLAEAGYEVAKAYDGLQALDRLVESDQLPDAILLDLIMPRLDGQRLTRFLKQDPLYAAIPVIILTGIASEDEGTILAFGADAYIAKGRIENTMVHILDTFRWLETRTGPKEKRTAVLGVEKLFPREMTRELLHIKGHLDTMLSLMGEGVVEIDQDHRILYANPAACLLLGSDDHRLFGKSLPGFFGDTARIEAYLASVPCGTEASPPPVQFEHGHRTLRISFSTLVEASNYCGSIVILADVTAQVRRERSLLELMEAIVQNAPVGLCLLGDTGTILASNPAFSRILHLPEGRTAIGAPLGAYLEGTGLATESLLPRADGLPGDEPRSVEFTTLVFPERVVLTTSTTVIETAEGRRVLLLIEDVTEKAAMERDLRRVNEELAKANRAKSTFLSMVSHELRTPLSVVRGYLSLILEGKIGPDPERILDALRVADKRARHLQHLIEELLDLSRIESGRLSLQREPIAVGKHVREVVEMFRGDQDRRKLSIEIEIPETLPDALADHDKVHQIFTNFLSNAVKFTGEGGRIVVRGRVAGSMLEFVVSDTGIGIPADKISQVFDKFYQVDSSDKRMYPGTGLGLAIVKMIVTALGGTVRVESRIGEGSTFTFTLPLAGTAAPAAQLSPAATPPSPPKLASAAGAAVVRTRVLIVDDDLDTLAMTRLLLPETHYEVVEAFDAFAGMREFYFRFPDIVLVDALLPLMSGLELCRVIKTHPERGSTPVVILSAAAQEEEIRSGYRVGADAYLVKPFRSQDLLDTLTRFSAH
jgi:signal transduction histidine kinase/DNA-binding response OmpR family regulator